MKQIKDAFSNTFDLVATPDRIDINEEHVERIWSRYRPAFQIAPIQSVTTYETPDFRIFYEGVERQVENDGWRYANTIILRNGDMYLRWRQKHSSDLLEVCVRSEE